ncbi:MAG: potassium-transporting ATPase subunit KdpC [Sandarakinorhabdus sp.]|nr:potassium-transporting ATPase subunit KdpC [Sandarakinorhabdus sp.]
MLTELRTALRPAFVLLIGFTLLLGIAYPLVVTGLARMLLPTQSGGSIVTADGKPIGSSLIGQDFTGAGYFHPRPSAAGKGHDASASSGSNLAPGSKDLATRIAASVAALRGEGVTGAIPGDLVTTSGSGLDPDISPEAAGAQVARVAKARGLAASDIAALVARHTDGRLLGVLGEPRVNVLALNRELDRISAAKAAKPPV